MLAHCFSPSSRAKEDIELKEKDHIPFSLLYFHWVQRYLNEDAVSIALKTASVFYL